MKQTALLFLLLVAACKREMSAEQACTKLTTLKNLTAHDRDRCEAEMSGPKSHERDCTVACIKAAKTGDEYDTCNTDCGPAAVDTSNLASYCQFVAEVGPDLKECGDRGLKYEASNRSNPTVLRCMTGCFRRTSDARPNRTPKPTTPTWSAAFDTCEKSCNATP